MMSENRIPPYRITLWDTLEPAEKDPAEGRSDLSG